MGLKVLCNIYCVTPAQRQQWCLQRQVYQSTQQNNHAARPYKSVCSLNLIPFQLHLISQASTFLPRGLGIMRPDGGTDRVSAYLADLAREHQFPFCCFSVDSVRSLTSSTAAINLSSSYAGLSLPYDIQQNDLVLKPFCIGLFFYLLSCFFFFARGPVTSRVMIKQTCRREQIQLKIHWSSGQNQTQSLNHLQFLGLCKCMV